MEVKKDTAVESDPSPTLPQLPSEQLAYARVLDAGMKAAIAILLVTFGMYAMNMRAPHIGLAQLSGQWHMSARQFTQDNCIATGTDWVNELQYGDYMNLMGVVFLAGMSIIAYIRVLPIFVARRDVTYAVITLAEIALLVLCVLGVFKIEH